MYVHRVLVLIHRYCSGVVSSYAACRTQTAVSSICGQGVWCARQSLFSVFTQPARVTDVLCRRPRTGYKLLADVLMVTIEPAGEENSGTERVGKSIILWCLFVYFIP